MHTKGTENVVADALSRVFEGRVQEGPDIICASLVGSLLLVYFSIAEHQSDEPSCVDLRQKLVTGQPGTDNFLIYRDLVCFHPKGAKGRRWVVPTILRPMLLKYFLNSALAGHLGAFKTFHRIAVNFWWPKMRAEIFSYVRKCNLYQHAKPAQNAQVGLHLVEP